MDCIRSFIVSCFLVVTASLGLETRRAQSEWFLTEQLADQKLPSIDLTWANFLRTKLDSNLTNDTMRQQLVRMTTAEVKSRDFVFYHATDSLTAFMYDVLSIAYSIRYGEQTVRPRLRFDLGPFEKIKSSSDLISFFTDSKGRIDDTRGSISNPKYPQHGAIDFRDVAISVNLGISANNGIPRTSSIYIWAANQHNDHFDSVGMFNRLMGNLGFSCKWEHFSKLYEVQKGRGGRMYQIFVKPEYADVLLYPAYGKGTPYRSSNLKEQSRGSMRHLIEYLRRTGQGIYYTNSRGEKVAYTGRMVMPPNLRPDAVTITPYDYSPLDQKSENVLSQEIISIIITSCLNSFLNGEMERLTIQLASTMKY